MLEFLKRLVSSPTDDRGRIDGSAGSDVVGKYFQLSVQIERAKADRNYQVAIAAARETYPLLPAFVESCKREYGKFDIGMSHAVHTAPTLMAVMGDREGLRELRESLSAVPELHDWLPAADDADHDASLVEGILSTVAEQPGVRQSDLKKRLGVPDARRLSTLADWLDKARRLRRVRTGSSYQLFPWTPAATQVATAMER